MAELQGKCHVAVHCQMGIERIALEYHGDVPVLGGHVIDQLAVDVQFAVGNILESRNHAQGRGFAAARRPDQHDELLVLNVQVHVMNSGHVSFIGFLQTFN